MASDTPAPKAAASKGRQDELRGLFFAMSSAVTLVSILVYLLLGFVAKGMASVTLLAYRLAFLTALGAHLYRASYTVLPRLTTFSGAALKRELLASNAVLRALYCAIFAFTRPTGLAWLPLAVHGAAQLGAFVVAKTRLGADPRVRGAYEKFQRALPQLLVMVSQLEVANAGVLLVAMFSSRTREVAKFAIYVNIFLRAAWHCNDDTIMKMRLPGSTSYYHRLTWALLDERTRPILRAVPQSHPMLQLDVGATSPPEVDAAESFFELSFPTPKSLKANHEWVDSSTLDQLRRDVEQLQDLVTRQQQRAERHTGAGSRADSSLGASRPESPKALDDAAALRLPYDVRLLQGRAAAAGEAPPRPWGEANLRQTEAVSVPYAQPRVLDLTVPSLEQPPGAVGTASPLRLLRRPRLDDCECGSDTAPLLLPPTVAVPLSEEAQALKTMFEARVAAVESRLQLALGEVLRESANLRLAVPPPAAPALASSHGQAATWREEVLESELVPHRGDGRPVPGSRAAVALTPFSAADTDAMCVARAEADDPFVVLLTWASDRPARLADMLGEAAGEGTASLTRGSLNALIRDTLVPGIDARGLRYVNLVLDCCQAQPPATNGDGGVTIAAFVAAIREGATAGASARATFHAPMAELMDRLAKSMDSHSQAWAFSSKCLPGGAFTATQLVLNANQLLPGGLLPRHKTLLAAQVHADASFGGPRHVFTLQQARQLCVPRHDRVAARKRVLAARVAYEHGARAPEKEVVMPLHPRPPPPPYVVDPPPRSTAGGAATSVSAAEQAALRQFAAATASVTRAAERVPPEAPLPPVTHSTQPPSELHVAHSVARAAVSELRSAETAKHHGPSPSGSRHHHASPRHKSGHHQQQHHHHRGVTTGSVDAQDMAGYALPPPGQEPKHQSIEQWLRTGGQPLGGGGAHAAEVHVPEKPAAHISTSVSGHAAAILKLQAAAAMAARLAVDAAAVRNEITLGLADAGKVETRLRGGKPWH